MNKPKAMLYTDRHQTNYFFCDPKQGLSPPEHISNHNVDYTIPRSEEAIKKGHKEDLPISFFDIEYGNIEAGKQWYLNKFPKLTEDFAYLLARYNWGDLKYATKKSLKNERKKLVKKTGKKKNVVMKINREPVLVKWD